MKRTFGSVETEGCMLAILGSHLIPHTCKVVSSAPSSSVRHNLLMTTMSASQKLEAVVCYRKDRMAPALRLLQQVCSFEPSGYWCCSHQQCPALIVLEAAGQLARAYQVSRHAIVGH